MPYFIRVRHEFCASHQLRLADGSLEPLHGHNFEVLVTVGSDVLDEIETVTDFHPLHAQLKAVCGEFDNRHLNDVEPFVARWNPSAERVAQAIAERLRVSAPVKLVSVEVSEAPGCWAIYKP